MCIRDSGNIKTEVSSKRENGNQVGNAKTTTYEYDAQNRLSKETVNGSVMTYTYDSFGNRATKTVEDSGALQQEVSYTYDDANRLKKTVEEQHNTYETVSYTHLDVYKRQLQIITCKVFENGTAYTSDVIEAIEFAQEKGAKVINLSLIHI